MFAGCDQTLWLEVTMSAKMRCHSPAYAQRFAHRRERTNHAAKSKVGAAACAHSPLLFSDSAIRAEMWM